MSKDPNKRRVHDSPVKYISQRVFVTFEKGRIQKSQSTSTFRLTPKKGNTNIDDIEEMG